MGTKVTVKSDRPWAEILEWCQTNVGKLLWSQPIIAWHGEGWHIKAGRDVAQRGAIGKPYYIINFEDKKHAVLFALWA